MDQNSKTYFSWTAPEYQHHERGLWWNVGFLVIAIAIIITAILTLDYFGAVSLSILAMLAFWLLRRKPRDVDISLAEDHLRLANLRIPYTQINQFWIVDEEHHNTLNFDTKIVIYHHIILSLADQDKNAIRNFLLERIAEHDQPNSTFTQKLAHRLKL